MQKADRIAAEKRGRRGEWLAAAALALKGYKVLARNVRTPRGEIDIIARRGALIAFVEVKARRDLAAALEAVTPRAWQRISASAEIWTARHIREPDLSWRYDIIAIRPGRWPIHVRDAWRPDFAQTRF